MEILNKIKDKWLVALVFVVSFGVFGNTLGHQFVWDDFLYIVNRAQDGTELNVNNIVSGKYPRDDTGVYRPARGVFDALTYISFGTNPKPYHFFVVALHAALATMVFWLIKELTENKKIAVIGGLVFATHPIHVEAVAWIMAGLDLLFVLFYIPSVVFYIKSIREKNGRFLQCSWAAAGASMFINELALTIPAIIMAVDYFVFGKKIKEIITSKALRGYLFAFGLYWLCRFYFLERVGQAEYVYKDLLSNTLLVVTMFGQYVKYLLVPVDLASDHLFPNGLTSLFVQNHNSDLPPPTLVLTDNWVILSVGLSLATIGAICFFRKSKPLVSFGLLWMWVTLLPGLGVIPIVGIFAERRAYLASVGFVLILAIAMNELAKYKKTKMVSSALIVLVLTWYSWQTVNRNYVWKDGLTLWSHTYAQNPRSAVAAHSIATHYEIEGNYEKALPYAISAIELDPYGGTFQERVNSLYIKLKMWNELLDFYEFYLKRDPHNADLLFRAGTLQENEFKNYKKAREYYNRVLEVLPENKQAIDALENLDSKKL